MWARPGSEGLFTVGITDPAQTMAGRVQYITFKKPGARIKAGKPLARLESGKWAGGIPAPFDGELVRVNERVAPTDLVNFTPYTDAWLAVMRPDDPARALDRLGTGPEAIEALKRWIDRYDVQCMRCEE